MRFARRSNSYEYTTRIPSLGYKWNRLDAFLFVVKYDNGLNRIVPAFCPNGRLSKIYRLNGSAIHSNDHYYKQRHGRARLVWLLTSLRQRRVVAHWRFDHAQELCKTYGYGQRAEMSRLATPKLILVWLWFLLFPFFFLLTLQLLLPHLPQFPFFFLLVLE